MYATHKTQKQCHHIYNTVTYVTAVSLDTCIAKTICCKYNDNNKNVYIEKNMYVRLHVVRYTPAHMCSASCITYHIIQDATYTWIECMLGYYIIVNGGRLRMHVYTNYG